MAFDPAQSIDPVAIQRLKVVLENQEVSEGVYNQLAQFTLWVRYDDGHTNVISGDLAPHLLSAEITALVNFMTTLRERAEDQIFPE